MPASPAFLIRSLAPCSRKPCPPVPVPYSRDYNGTPKIPRRGDGDHLGVANPCPLIPITGHQAQEDLHFSFAGLRIPTLGTRASNPAPTVGLARSAHRHQDVIDCSPWPSPRCRPPRRHAHVPLFPAPRANPEIGTPPLFIMIVSDQNSKNISRMRVLITYPCIPLKKALNACWGINTLRLMGKSRAGGIVIAGGHFGRRSSSVRRRGKTPVPGPLTCIAPPGLAHVVLVRV
jgi:hypothetical protein